MEMTSKMATVPIDPATVEILDRWKERRKPRSEWFFSTIDGGRLHDSYVRHMVARYGRRAGIEIRCHPHLLRHTYATELLEAGRSVAEVMQLLGHERMETTSLYLHVSDKRLRDWIMSRDT